MKGIFGVVVIFVSVCLVLFLAVSMFSAVPLPGNDTEEYETYQSLTDIVSIAFNGIWGVLLLIILLLIGMIVFSLKIGLK